MCSPGDIFKHTRFYVDRSTGEFKPKYLLILSAENGRDLVARLLTSREHGRPEDPPCFHGDPYPSYYLGFLGGQLGKKSWLDLRSLDDIDVDEFRRAIRKNIASRVTSLSAESFTEALDCTARADDTTRQQENLIRDTLARLR